LRPIGMGDRDVSGGDCQSRGEAVFQPESTNPCRTRSLLTAQHLRPTMQAVNTAHQTFVMLENETLWDLAQRCERALNAAEIPHAVVGGVAVCLHGYRRNTVDLDVLIRREDSEAVRGLMQRAGLEWSADRHEFRNSAGIPVQFLLAGERAGAGLPVKLPDPADDDCVMRLEDISVLSLPRLLEIKIACGEGNLRRSHKDFADVVELIAVNNLDGSFARNLHRSVRATFRELVRAAHTKE